MNEQQLSEARRRFAGRMERIARERAVLRDRVTAMTSRTRSDNVDGAKELAEFARSPEAPADLRSVQFRIDRGEFTWRQVLTGEVRDDAVDQFLASTRAYFADTAQVFQAADDLVRAEGLSSDEATERAMAELERRR